MFDSSGAVRRSHLLPRHKGEGREGESNKDDLSAYEIMI
jgi:hypothetical protein